MLAAFHTPAPLAAKHFCGSTVSPKSHYYLCGQRVARFQPASFRAVPVLTPHCNLRRPKLVQSGWSRAISTIPQSFVLSQVLPQVGLSFVCSSSVVLAYICWTHFAGQTLPPLPATPHGFLATTVSLILVFRTNASYDRYWEGRKLWGACVNTCRNLARMCKTSMDPDVAQASALLIVAYAHTLAQRLQQTRGPEPISTLLAPFPKLSKRINDAANRPLECLSAIGELVEKEYFRLETGSDTHAPVNIGANRMNAEECLREMINHLGATERICTTPVPLSYSRHCSRMISFFVLTLPFVIVGQPGGVYICVPACVLLTWALCGVDEVARMIEDPFLGEHYSLDIDTLCAKIERDVLGQIVPQAQSSKGPDRFFQTLE